MKGYLIIKFVTGKGFMYEVNNRGEYQRILELIDSKFGSKVSEIKFMKNVITTNKISTNLLSKLNNTVVIIKGNTGYLNKNETVKLKILEGGKK